MAVVGCIFVAMTFAVVFALVSYLRRRLAPEPVVRVFDPPPAAVPTIATASSVAPPGFAGPAVPALPAPAPPTARRGVDVPAWAPAVAATVAALFVLLSVALPGLRHHESRRERQFVTGCTAAGMRGGVCHCFYRHLDKLGYLRGEGYVRLAQELDNARATGQTPADLRDAGLSCLSLPR